MGVLNVTPDSFSDGGDSLDADRAVATALRLADEGADYIDVGAESTRPGAVPVSSQAEWHRLEPVLDRLAQRTLGAKLSIDTRKPEIMLKAAEAGVGLINDSSGTADGSQPGDPANPGADDKTLQILASRSHIRYCAMHMHGTPQTMQQNPLRGQAAVTAVDKFFAGAEQRLRKAGFAQSRLWLDPGIGFGKDDTGNVALLAHVPAWSKTLGVAIGISRKGFIGRLLDITRPEQRDAPSKMLEFGLAIAGARLIRTHDVKRLAHLRSMLTGGH